VQFAVSRAHVWWRLSIHSSFNATPRYTHGEHEPAPLDIRGLGARVGERFCEDAVQVRGRRCSAAGRIAGEQELLDRRREVSDRHRGGREQEMSSSSRAPQSAPRMSTMTLMANVREDFAPTDDTHSLHADPQPHAIYSRSSMFTLATYRVYR
jgi:hypothetical protein